VLLNKWLFCKNGQTGRHAFRVRMDEMTCTPLPWSLWHLWSK